MNTLTLEFPFAAVTGQAQFKLALILAAINPDIGGVLVSGPRGTAKSTLARGLPSISPSNRNFITLPLGASEEMLVGTLDLQKIMDGQAIDFRPGLLSKAHHGVLYVDEVNLLADNLIDLLLDVSASGVNRVERDGVSHSHEARFILLGTMNPDEGELRPQLLDRFGLSVQIDHRYSVEDRVTIVKLREAFDRDPKALVEAYAAEQQQIRKRIESASTQLEQMDSLDAIRLEIAQRCMAANVDGMRADIVWHRAALAHAAWCGRLSVTVADLDAVEDLVLAHRRNQDGSNKTEPPSQSSQTPSSSQPQTQPQSGDWGQMNPTQQLTASSKSFEPPKFTGRSDKTAINWSETYSKSQSDASRGGSKRRKLGTQLDWFQTLVSNLGTWPLRVLRYQKVTSGAPLLNLILLDTSASTLKNRRFAEAKAVIVTIAKRAYLAREQLTILGFGNQRVETLLKRVRAPKALLERLDNIEAGGGTPLREVIEQAQCYQRTLARSSPNLKIRNYLITDGKSSAALNDLSLIGETILIDIEDSRVKRGRGVEIADALGANYVPLLA